MFEPLRLLRTFCCRIANSNDIHVARQLLRLAHDSHGCRGHQPHYVAHHCLRDCRSQSARSGLLEAPYRLALVVEFGRACLAYEMEKPLDVMYGDARLGCGYRLDFVVEEKVVVEVKSLAVVLAVHRAQLLTYLRLSGYPAGLLLNFNVPLMKDGIHRVLNDQPAK